MTVSSVTNPQSAISSSSSSASPPTTVDYNQFLQLLIAQMKNQDPTSPTDMSQY
jgi:flagellar basal-body rod modification protein FlgD